MRILGIDQAVTESGYCILEEGEVKEISSYKPKNEGFSRIIEIQDFFEKLAKDIDAIVIEGYAFGRAQKSEMMGELGGALKYMCYRNAIPLFVIPPTKMKKFATGKGNANKTETIIRVVRRWNPESENEHALESFVLAKICYNYYNKEAKLTSAQELVMNEVKVFDFEKDT